MPEQIKDTTSIIIPRLTPYFLGKPVLWFKKNQHRLRVLVKQPWGQNQLIILEQDQYINPFTLLRQMADFGYQKVSRVLEPGQFAHRGAIVDIFALGSVQPWRLEFVGNQLSRLYQFSIKARKTRKTLTNFGGKAKMSLSQMVKPGDYLVHLDHGIGQFLKIVSSVGTGRCPVPTAKNHTLTMQETRGYFILEYAQADKLFVPLALADKLSLYLGFRRPLVHRLGGALWQKTKKKISQSTLELARELLKIYAQREMAAGFVYAADGAEARELTSDFAFEETEDQKQAILDINKDMEGPYKMDRLVCGDVGFGKTEVALRAAFKAVISSKQVAFLAPTTILAQQHFWNFKHRLAPFAVNLALLSRLQTKAEQRQIVQKTSQGQMDLLIGTHRLLSRDVHFKNLGLVIIDEEQRFGVRQKEKFKKIRANIDVLCLSATPIPRTLYLALAGLREISQIQTPPPGRLPIKTFIQPYRTAVIKKAISQELARQGQIYFLHNRIETIELVRQKLLSLFPTLKIGVAHGRLSEKELIRVMNQLRKRQIDLLLATTIIENGLDFPNVNTLIVEDATKLGLSQAYQIRGRIGRSPIQAFAYFLFRPKNLTDIARRRLETLQEAEALGSGYEIAKRDLEIRGAGNILGREQAGHINAVGLNLYCQMLNEAVRHLKNMKHET